MFIFILSVVIKWCYVFLFVFNNSFVLLFGFFDESDIFIFHRDTTNYSSQLNRPNSLWVYRPFRNKTLYRFQKGLL